MTIAELDQRAETLPPHGELAHLTAEFLTDKGLRVTELEQRDRRDSVLVIHEPGVRCRLFIGDRGEAELLWQPEDPEAADPLRVADLVAALLSADVVERNSGAATVSGTIPFRGMVGRELAARGFHAELRIYPDKAFFDAIAYVTVTRPETDADETDDDDTEIVYVDDDHSFTWVADFRYRDLSTTDIARAIADTVARAGFGRG